MISNLAQVAIGGAIGAALRFLSLAAIAPPWGTVVVNVLGSFAMGMFFVALPAKSGLSPLVMTGVLGGFTTFSAFSLDTMKMWQAGQFGLASVYVGISVALSLCAIAAGAAAAKGVLA